jgi:predicted CxxxxCH...CXXCH cytochrome family protein
MDHANGAVDLAFSGLATQGGVTPVWDGTGCAATYCHGNFQNGATGNTPSWTAVGGAACGSCHGLPPGGSHPSNPACGSCHPGYTSAQVNLSLHLNGAFDVITLTCASCHGDGARSPTQANPLLPAAPPTGTRGETLVTQRAVGAHQAHLTGGRLGPVTPCTACHQPPAAMDHANGAVELAFSGLATQGGVTPVWDGTGCAATYCHGNFQNGATGNTPSWTGAGGAACGSCHGLPPGGSHPNNPACGSCHPGYTSAQVNLSLHLNGAFDVITLTCASCHGDGARSPTQANPLLPAAPPTGTRGETLVTQRAVGAHQAHLTGGRLGLVTPCTACHQPPAAMDHANGAVELAFSGLATQGGVTPVWDGTGCAATYCHGNFQNGATGNTPSWTGAGGAACGSCHGLPPGGSHPSNPACGSCHPGYTSAQVNLSLHLNGAFDVTTLTCASCHGDGARSPTHVNPLLPAAPPTGTRGETLVTQRAVGAHQAHLTVGRLGFVTPCTACHQPPTAMDHANGAVELAFSGLATQGGVTPVWDGTGCAATYCHGNFPGGTRGNTPAWTGTNQGACGTCHGLAPATGQHWTHAGEECSGCHGTGYVGREATTSVNAAIHLDGALQVGGPGSLISTFSRVSRTCASDCHDVQTW